jgi:hypothetical protein
LNGIQLFTRLIDVLMVQSYDAIPLIPNFFSLFSSRALDKESYCGQIAEILPILVQKIRKYGHCLVVSEENVIFAALNLNRNDYEGTYHWHHAADSSGLECSDQTLGTVSE